MESFSSDVEAIIEANARILGCSHPPVSIRSAMVQQLTKLFAYDGNATCNGLELLANRVLDCFCYPAVQLALSCFPRGCEPDVFSFFTEVIALMRVCLPISSDVSRTEQCDALCVAIMKNLGEWQLTYKSNTTPQPCFVRCFKGVALFAEIMLSHALADTRVKFSSLLESFITRDTGLPDQLVLCQLIVPLMAVYSNDVSSRLVSLLMEGQWRDTSALLRSMCAVSNGPDRARGPWSPLLEVCLCRGVTHGQHGTRKLARHLLQRTLHERAEGRLAVDCPFLPWYGGESHEVQLRQWQTFFLVLETLEEKQQHLIEPVLSRFDRLTDSTCLLPSVTILAVLRRALTHGSLFLKRWAVLKSLRLPDTPASFIYEDLVPALNNASLFFDTDEESMLLGIGEWGDSAACSAPHVSPPVTEVGRSLALFFTTFLSASAGGGECRVARLFSALLRQSWCVAALTHTVHALLCCDGHWRVTAPLLSQVCQYVERMGAPVCVHEAIHCQSPRTATRMMLLTIVSRRLSCSPSQLVMCVIDLCRVTNHSCSFPSCYCPLLPLSPSQLLSFPAEQYCCRFVWSDSVTALCSEDWPTVKADILAELAASCTDPQRRLVLSRAILTLCHAQSAPLSTSQCDSGSGGGSVAAAAAVACLHEVVTRVCLALSGCHQQLYRSSVLAACDLTLLTECLRAGVLLGDQLPLDDICEWLVRQNCVFSRSVLRELPYRAAFTAALANCDVAQYSGAIWCQVLSPAAFSRYLSCPAAVVSALLSLAALCQRGVTLTHSDSSCTQLLLELVQSAVQLDCSAVLQSITTTAPPALAAADEEEFTGREVQQLLWRGVWSVVCHVTHSPHRLTTTGLVTWSTDLLRLGASEFDLCDRHVLAPRLFSLASLLLLPISASPPPLCLPSVLAEAWRAVAELRHHHCSVLFQQAVAAWCRLLLVGAGMGAASRDTAADSLSDLVTSQLLPLSECSGSWVLLALLRQLDWLLHHHTSPSSPSPHPPIALLQSSCLAERLLLPPLLAAVLCGNVHRRDRRALRAAHVLAQRVRLPCVSRDCVGEGGVWMGVGDNALWTDRAVRLTAVRLLCRLHQLNPAAFLLAVDRLRHTMTSQRQRHFGNSLSHLLQLRSCQAMLVLHPYLPEDVLRGVFGESLQLLLTQTVQPSVRRVLQFLLVRAIISQPRPTYIDTVWRYVDQAVQCRSGVVGVFADVVYHVAAASAHWRIDGASVDQFFVQCFHKLLPYTMSQHYITRLCCQVTLSRIWKLAASRGLTGLLVSFEGCVSALEVTLAQAAREGKTQVTALDFFYTAFDPVRCFSLASIYLHLPRLTHVGCEEWLPMALLESQLPFHSAQDYPSSSDFPQLLCPVSCCSSTGCPLASVSPLCPLPPYPTEETPHLSSRQRVSSGGETSYSSSVVQRKIAPWRHLLGDNVISEHSRSDRQVGPVLVASLVERAPNLGGLCRTCEVFGASQMTVNSLSVVTDSQFTSLSVSAEKWLRIVEVGRHALADYLRQQQQLGRQLVALEQTCDSVCLTQCQLSPNCVIVLGNEREGIPVDLLSCFDTFVEIPQSGVIRSLNVHVAGALVLWQYWRQHSTHSANQRSNSQ